MLIKEKVLEEEDMQIRIAGNASSRHERGPRRKEHGSPTGHQGAPPAADGDRKRGQGDGDNGEGDHSSSSNGNLQSDLGNQKTAATPQAAPVPAEWNQHHTYLDVYVSAVEHPEHFWVQVISTKATRLDQLSHDMTSYYKTLTDDEECVAGEVQVGDLLAAPFEHDDMWYRVRVAEVDGDKVDVYYVDFGDSSFLEKKQLKSLRGDFLSLPLQAIEVCLANVKPKGGEWSEEAICLFEDLTHTAKWKVLNARTISYSQTKDGDPIPCLELVDTNSTTDINVAKELIEKDFAEYTQETVIDTVTKSPDATSITQIVDVSSAAARKAISPTTMIPPNGLSCLSLEETPFHICKHSDSDQHRKGTFDNMSNSLGDIVCEKDETESIMIDGASPQVLCEITDQPLLEATILGDEFVADLDFVHDAEDDIVSHSVCVNNNPSIEMTKPAVMSNDIKKFSDWNIFNPHDCIQQAVASSQYPTRHSQVQYTTARVESVSKVLRPTTLSLNVKSREDGSGHHTRGIDEKPQAVFSAASTESPHAFRQPGNISIDNVIEDTNISKLCSIKQLDTPFLSIPEMQPAPHCPMVQKGDSPNAVSRCSSDKTCGMASSVLECMNSGCDILHQVNSEDVTCPTSEPNVCSAPSSDHMMQATEITTHAIVVDTTVRDLHENDLSRDVKKGSPDASLNVKICTEFSTSGDSNLQAGALQVHELWQDEVNPGAVSVGEDLSQNTENPTMVLAEVTDCCGEDDRSKYVVQSQHIDENDASPLVLDRSMDVVQFENIDENGLSPLVQDKASWEKEGETRDLFLKPTCGMSQTLKTSYQCSLPENLIAMKMIQAGEVTNEYSLKSQDTQQSIEAPDNDVNLQEESNQCFITEENNVKTDGENKGTEADEQVFENREMHLGDTNYNDEFHMHSHYEYANEEGYSDKSCAIDGMAHGEEVSNVERRGGIGNDGAGNGLPCKDISEHVIKDSGQLDPEILILVKQSTAEYVAFESHNLDMRCHICGIPVAPDDCVITDCMDDKDYGFDLDDSQNDRCFTGIDLPEINISNCETDQTDNSCKPTEDISFCKTHEGCHFAQSTLQAGGLISPNIEKITLSEEHLNNEIVTLDNVDIQEMYMKKSCSNIDPIEEVMFCMEQAISDVNSGSNPILTTDKITNSVKELFAKQPGITEYNSSESDEISEDSTSERTVLSASFGSELNGAQGDTYVLTEITDEDKHCLSSCGGGITIDHPVVVCATSSEGSVRDPISDGDLPRGNETNECSSDEFNHHDDSQNGVQSSYDNQTCNAPDRTELDRKQFQCLRNADLQGTERSVDGVKADANMEGCPSVVDMEESIIAEADCDEPRSEGISKHYGVPQKGSANVKEDERKPDEGCIVHTEHIHGCRSDDEKDVLKMGQLDVENVNTSRNTCSTNVAIKLQSKTEDELENVNKQEIVSLCACTEGDHTGKDTLDSCQALEVLVTDTPKHCVTKDLLLVHDDITSSLSEGSSTSSCRELIEACKGEECLEIEIACSLETSAEEDELLESFILNHSDKKNNIFESLDRNQCDSLDEKFQVDWSDVNICLVDEGDRNAELVSSCCDEKFTEVLKSYDGTLSDAYIKHIEPSYANASARRQNSARLVGHLSPKNAPSYRRSHSTGDIESRRWSECSPSSLWSEDETTHSQLGYAEQESLDLSEEEISSSTEDSLEEHQYCLLGARHRSPSRGYTSAAAYQRQKCSTGETRHCSLYEEFQDMLEEVYGHASMLSTESNTSTSYASAVEDLDSGDSLCMTDSLEDLTVQNLEVECQGFQCSSPSPSSMSQDSLNDKEDVHHEDTEEEDFWETSSMLMDEGTKGGAKSHIINGKQLNEAAFDMNITPIVEMSPLFPVLTPTRSWEDAASHLGSSSKFMLTPLDATEKEGVV